MKSKQVEKDEFAAYLRNCTDTQVRNVWKKERAANRRSFTQLAFLEMTRRGAFR